LERGVLTCSCPSQAVGVELTHWLLGFELLGDLTGRRRRHDHPGWSLVQGRACEGRAKEEGPEEEGRTQEKESDQEEEGRAEEEDRQEGHKEEEHQEEVEQKEVKQQPPTRCLCCFDRRVPSPGHRFPLRAPLSSKIIFSLFFNPLVFVTESKFFFSGLLGRMLALASTFGD
jgi:hypothetical protein